MTLLLNASAPKELPTHGTLSVRNDAYVYAGSVKTMYWSALTKDGWVVSNDIVLPDGPTAGQQYSFSVSYP